MSCTAALYVVATPIGNLSDMVPRALEILQKADVIAAEDTRHSRRLLEHFGITTALVAYHDHSDNVVLSALRERWRRGEQIALISDAGTPLVSDPGYRLVDAAHQDGVTVSSIPGPCAAIAALAASGLPSDRFSFEGFLLAKSGARRQRLRALAAETRTLIFYEAPHRISEMLADCAAEFGEQRSATLCRELTKRFETVRRGPLAELHAWVGGDANQQRGECVVVIAGAQRRPDELEGERVLRLLLVELPLKRAAALAASISGDRKNRLYEVGLGWSAEG